MIIDNNLTWHGGAFTRADRESKLKQTASTIWLTGLSGSGKSSIAVELEQQLAASGKTCFILDGDNVRHGLSRDLGFTLPERSENIRRIAEVAKLMNDAGLIVIVAIISPSRVDRKLAATIIGADHFHEIYVSTPLRVCEERDPKGLYHKARSGSITNFTGISAPYEAPRAPSISVDNSEQSVAENVQKILQYLGC